MGLGPQRQLRIHLQAASLVNQGEQPLPDIAKGFLIATRSVGRRVQPRRSSAPLNLARVQQRREVLGHLTKDSRLATALGGLDGVPVAQHLSRISHLGLPEHVGMTPDELLATVLGYRGQVTRATLLQEQRQEVHLEQHIAKLVDQLGVITGEGRVGELVGLLERMRHDRTLVLLAIPRTLTSQTSGERIEISQRLGNLGIGQRRDDSRRGRYLVLVVDPEAAPVLGVLVVVCGVVVCGVAVPVEVVGVLGAL
jgi:hypothetical protein